MAKTLSDEDFQLVLDALAATVETVAHDDATIQGIMDRQEQALDVMRRYAAT